MLSQMISTLIKLKFSDCYDGDFVDRLNHKYTALLMAFFGMLVAGKQYGGDPISCWCPGHFTSNWIDYTNTICWVTNTYFLPLNQILELAKTEGDDNEIKYYQWTPIILIAMGFLFYLPYMVWKFACFAIGIDMDHVISSLTTYDAVLSPEIWDKTLDHVVNQFERFIDGQRETRKGFPVSAKKFFFVCNKRCGGYLTAMYICLKATYLLNAYCLVFILNNWLGQGFHYYGFETLSDTMSISSNNLGGIGLGQSSYSVKRWMGGDRFPYVSMCDFTARIMGNLHGYTVQCVLKINMFNEKIFLIVWLWFVAVALITTVNFGLWTFRIVWCGDRFAYVYKHLKFSGRIHDHSGSEAKKNARKFTHGYLRSDGIFLIRLISKNASSLVTSELVARLYDNYMAKPRFDTSGNLLPPNTRMTDAVEKLALTGGIQVPTSAGHDNRFLLRSGSSCDFDDRMVDERGMTGGNLYPGKLLPNAPPLPPPPGFMEATRGHSMMPRQGFVSAAGPMHYQHQRPLPKSNSNEVGFPPPENAQNDGAKLGLEMMENPVNYSGGYVIGSTTKINKDFM